MLESDPEAGPPLTRRSLLALLAASAAGACANQPDPRPFAPPIPGLGPLLTEQARIYPRMQGRDIYKLLYQATIGPSNFFIGSESRCLQGLLAEIKQLQPAIHEGEEEFENLNADTGLVRVNLRPYLKRGGKAEELAHALCMTTRHHRGEVAQLEASLVAAEELVEGLGIGVTRDRFLVAVMNARKKNFDLLPHSTVYALTYRPAYRVVMRDFLTDATYGGRRDVYSG